MMSKLHAISGAFNQIAADKQVPDLTPGTNLQVLSHYPHKSSSEKHEY